MGLAGALALAGCGNTGPATPPAPCPRITILADGADLTRFQPGAVQDLATTTFDARLVGFQASCDYARRRGGVAVTLSVLFALPLGGGVTAVGLKLQLEPVGMLAQLRVTALLKPLTDPIVQVLVAAGPP